MNMNIYIYIYIHKFLFYAIKQIYKSARNTLNENLMFFQYCQDLTLVEFATDEVSYNGCLKKKLLNKKCLLNISFLVVRFDNHVCLYKKWNKKL